MKRDKNLSPEFITLLALIAYKEGEISEERCCEVTGFKRADLRKEMERRCGLSRPYTDMENMVAERDSQILKLVNEINALKHAKPDWRIGLTVKPKYRTHELHYERGTIRDVHPDGTGGVHDKDGVLKIEMQTGQTILAPADEWVTA